MGQTRTGWRRVLWWALVTTAAAMVAMVGLGAWWYDRAQVTNVGDLDFAQPLRIPDLAEPTVDDQGRTVFDLAVQAGESELLEGRITDTWGVNGPYLGPTLRVERGEEVVVNLHNQLGETTTMHWHGMHLPAEMNGGPHQPVASGETWSPTWAVDQPAATLWYHPHPHGATEEHVYRGVAGMFILDDDEAGALDLPDDYGVDDVPVIVQDKRFDEDGSLDHGSPLMSQVGMLGDEILVNGTHDPHFDVTTTRVRLRLLNASTARTYDFGFTDDRAFSLIGTDGGLLTAPHETDRVMLSPGERAEIVVAFEPGDDVVLRSFAPDLGTDFFTSRFSGGDDTFDILRLVATDELTPSGPVPDELIAVDRLAEADATETRRFELSGRQINGRSMDMGRIDATVELGATEVWELANIGGAPHNFHVHDVQFQVLDVDGAEPQAGLSGWKDTLFLPPGTEARIITRFTDYADPTTPYMFHCHLLQHEDQGMMGQFVVVEPGQEPVDQISTAHQGH